MHTRALNGRRDLNLEGWPTPDVSVLDPSVQDRFHKRQNAVKQYAAGISFKQIRRDTGISEREVSRLISRCLAVSSSGGVVGFYGCIPDFRVKRYERRKPITPSLHLGKGGSSGALQQLFQSFPCAKCLVDDLYLKRPRKGHIHEQKITIKKIQDHLIKHLRGLGFTDTTWPFNAKNRGYMSLSTYLKGLHREHARVAAVTRYGQDASARWSAGTGHLPTITARRPFEIMQMDYQLVDCASIFVIKNKFDVEIEVQVPRWYYGVIGDEFNGLITGLHIGMESNPSSDGALKLIDSSINPKIYLDSDSRIAYIADGRILPNELLPTISYQCFSILRVDNAWGNAARDTVNNIIDTVGCCVDFGPPRAWWHRPIAERIFKALTGKGLQRLPASYGTGPNDPSIVDPAAKASQFRIDISELVSMICAVVRLHNEDISSGREFCSPLQAMQAAISHPRSGFIPQPLPHATQENPRLLRHVHECRIVGNPKKGIRPHVVWDKCTYTNPTLAERIDLIGEWLVLYCALDDIRDVVATVKGTGQDLGYMVPERRWRDRPVSVRFRKLINQHGGAKRMAVEQDDPYDTWQQNKLQELAQLKTAKRRFGKRGDDTQGQAGKSDQKLEKPSSSDVLLIAKDAAFPSPVPDEVRAPNPVDYDDLEPPTVAPTAPIRSGFGNVLLDDLPVFERKK